MNARTLSKAVLVTSDQATARKRLREYMLSEDKAWHADIRARRDVYQAAVDAALPALPQDVADALRAMWGDITADLDGHPERADAPSLSEDIKLTAYETLFDVFWNVHGDEQRRKLSDAQFERLATVAGDDLSWLTD